MTVCPAPISETGQIVYREVRKNTACIMRKKQKGRGGGVRGKGVAKQQQDPRNEGSLSAKIQTQPL
jgi:hypothetical protein